MQKKTSLDIFNATNSLKVLSFLSENPGKEFLSSEIQKATSISRSGVYIALRKLKKQHLILKIKKGNFFLYSILYNDSIIKQFKVLKNIMALNSLVSTLKSLSMKIVLYGSTSRGENDPESDIDIFIVSSDPDGVRKKLISIRSKQKIQAIVKTSTELTDFKEKEKVFCAEVERGIILWEEEHGS